MDRFGVELREARETRDVSIDAMSEATKVSVRHLQALEAGRYGDLPGGVFRRGILRSYLGALGLDEAAWMERFEASCRETGHAGPEDADWTAFAQNVKRSREQAERRSSLRWLGIFAMLLALALLGVGVWKFVLHRRLTPLHPVVVGRTTPGTRPPDRG